MRITWSIRTDTYILDNVARFVGQRIAAVVAENEAAAEAACRLPRGRIRNPAGGIRSGRRDGTPMAPVLHDKGLEAKGNIYVDIGGEVGSVADGLAAADAVHEMSYSTLARPARASGDARLHLLAQPGRTAACAHQFAGAFHCAAEALPPVWAAPARTCTCSPSASGGGFGGKQEMISEDLCVLAMLKTGRPVKWEFTREEQFTGATTRHQMTTRVKLGAKRDGTLTAIDVQVVSNTGAYGGHAGETLGASLGSPLTSYRCANKKAIGHAVYTNMVPAGGFRGYGASQTTFAIECAIDDLGRLLGIDPFEIRRKNMVRPGETGSSRCGRIRATSTSAAMGSTSAWTWSRRRLATGNGVPAPAGDDWAEGNPASRSPCWNAARRPKHRAGAQMMLRPDGSYHLAVGIDRRWATAR